MKHIDHHTLELHVLGSPSIRGKSRGITRHLAACPHCRAIADEILLIYVEAEKQVQAVQHAPAVSDGLVAGWSERVLTSRDSDARQLIRVNRSLVQRFVRFSRSHPIAASSGVVTAIVFLVLGTTNVMRWMGSPSNPSIVHYDTSKDILEVYDGNENLLWRKPSRALAENQATETSLGIRLAAIGDLAGDGRNEVITMLPVESANGQPLISAVRIFDSQGNVLGLKTIEANVNFSGRAYQGTQFWGAGLSLVRSPNGTGLDVVASAPNYRSPNVVVRLNERGELLGEYWHFGHLSCIPTVQNTAASGGWVVLMGSNDVEDSTGGRFLVLVVLDAARIIGRSEATATRGFGYPASAAEIAYIRIPQSDMDKPSPIDYRRVKFLPGDGNHWSFIVIGTDSINASCFEYVLGSDLRIESVRSTDTNNLARSRMRKRGLLRGEIDQQYLDDLKNSVEYWDGQVWTREFRLVHPISTPQ